MLETGNLVVAGLWGLGVWVREGYLASVEGLVLGLEWLKADEGKGKKAFQI